MRPRNQPAPDIHAQLGVDRTRGAVPKRLAHHASFCTMALAYSTVFEYARIVGLRKSSLELNGKTLVRDVTNVTTPDAIVAGEIKDPKLLPVTLHRPGPLPGQATIVRPEQLRIEHSYSQALFPDALLKKAAALNLPRQRVRT